LIVKLILAAIANPMTRPRAPTMNTSMGSEMAVLQGSPTYKQRRRRTSISQHMSMVGNPQNAQFGHRPRAASVAENGLRNTLFNQGFQRHTTPLRDSPYQRTVTPIPNQIQPIFHAHEELAKLQMEHDERYSTASPMPMDMRNSVTPGPGDGSPAKTFTCPVPTCGRLFKRLEHLKRHVRTHTQERPYICGICAKKFSRSDNLAQYVPLVSFANVRHRKTHERTGATQSPSARNTPCDSSRNTPVSGDEESDAHNSDQSHHSEHLYQYTHATEIDEERHNITEYTQPQPYHPSHFRSFSHDGHLNHYNLAPTSHSITNLNGVHPATPPNEVEEDISHGVDDAHSSIDSDGSHSYNGDISSGYVHQQYHGLSADTAHLEVAANGDMLEKNGLMMSSDQLQREYLSHPPITNTSIMAQGWGYQ
jgi:hypothetical protein